MSGAGAADEFGGAVVGAGLDVVWDPADPAPITPGILSALACAMTISLVAFVPRGLGWNEHAFYFCLASSFLGRLPAASKTSDEEFSGKRFLFGLPITHDCRFAVSSGVGDV